VGQALARAGIPITESDESTGVYQISVPEDLNIEEAEPGFYTFSDGNGFYSFSVTSGTGTRVMVTQAGSYRDGASGAFVPAGAAQSVPDIHLGSNNHVITAIKYGAGALTPSGAVPVPHSGGQTFTFAPDAGYSLNEVRLDGSPVTASNPYPVNNVTTNRTLEVSFKNDVPVAYAKTVTVAEGGSVSDVLSGSDTETPAGALGFEKMSDPGMGALALSGTGSFTYDLQGSNVNGSDSFTFRVWDGGVQSSNIATVTINILPENDAPVANPLSIMVNEYTDHVGTLTATDVDGPSITYSIFSQGKRSSGS